MQENDYMGKIRREILSRIDPSARTAVERDLDRLARLGVASVQDALAVAQDPRSPDETRAIAIWFLGQTGEAPPRMRLALAEMLTAESDEKIVWELAKVIATASDPNEKTELADRLSLLLGMPQHSGKRRPIAFALGLLGEARAIAPLAKVLAEASEEFKVCEETIEALANLGNPSAAEALIATSKHVFDLQAELIRALVEIADPRAAAHLERIADSAASLHQEIVLALSRVKAENRDSE